MTRTSRQQFGSGLVNPYEVATDTSGVQPAIAAGAVLLGAAGLVVLAAGPASAEPVYGDDVEFGVGPSFEPFTFDESPLDLFGNEGSDASSAPDTRTYEVAAIGTDPLPPSDVLASEPSAVSEVPEVAPAPEVFDQPAQTTDTTYGVTEQPAAEILGVVPAATTVEPAGDVTFTEAPASEILGPDPGPDGTGVFDTGAALPAGPAPDPSPSPPTVANPGNESSSAELATPGAEPSATGDEPAGTAEPTTFSYTPMSADFFSGLDPMVDTGAPSAFGRTDRSTKDQPLPARPGSPSGPTAAPAELRQPGAQDPVGPTAADGSPGDDEVRFGITDMSATDLLGPPVTTGGSAGMFGRNTGQDGAASPAPAPPPAARTSLPPVDQAELRFGVTDPATTAPLMDDLRLPEVDPGTAGPAPGVFERTLRSQDGPAGEFTAARPGNTGRPASAAPNPAPGGRPARPGEPVRDTADGQVNAPSGRSRGTEDIAPAVAQTGALAPYGGLPRPQPDRFADTIGAYPTGVPAASGPSSGLPSRSPSPEAPDPPGATDKPWVSFRPDQRLLNSLDPACWVDPNCEKVQFSIPPTAYGYGAAGVPPTIGVTAAVQYKPPTPTSPGVPMGTAFRNGVVRFPFGFVQDLGVSGAINNVPLFEDPKVDKVAKTVLTSAVVTVGDVGLRKVVNPAIDRWAAANASKVPLARALGGGGIRTDSGLKPGPLAAIPFTVNGGLAVVDAVEAGTGFGKVTATDASNLDYYRDISMRGIAVGAGVGGPITYNILKTGGDKRLIPLPFVLPAAQSVLSQVAFGPPPPHPDGFTSFVRGGAQKVSTGFTAVGQAVGSADQIRLDPDKATGDWRDLKRIGGIGLNLTSATLDVGSGLVEKVGLGTASACAACARGELDNSLIPQKNQDSAARNLSNAGRSVNTLIFDPNRSDIARNLRDSQYQVATMAGNVAKNLDTAFLKPARNFGGFLQEKFDGAQTFVNTDVKPVVSAGINLLGCGRTECPPASPALAGPKKVGPKVVGPKVVGPKTVGPRTVGARTVGPKLVGPKLVGPATVGPLYVGDGSGTPVDRAWTGLQNLSTGRPIREAVAGPIKAVQEATSGPIKAFEGFVKDPVGTVTRGWQSLWR